MAIVVATVISRNELGRARLMLRGATHEQRRGERLTLDCDDGTHFILNPTDGVVVAPTTRESAAWGSLSNPQLRGLFSDLSPGDDEPVELEGWLITTGSRLAVHADLHAGVLHADRIVIMQSSQSDDEAITALEALVQGVGPAPRPVAAVAVDDPEAELARFLGEDEGERHIEMTWRCNICKQQNLGRFKRCQGCGKPKDASEEYEMPADPASAASVTDAALLRMAKAGPDWRCAYCNSDQRASDGNCGQCGASAGEGSEVPDVMQPIVAPPKRWWIRYAIGAAAAVVVLIGVLIWNHYRAHDYGATVAAASWEQVIDVERYANRDHEDFQESIPKDATEVTSVGQKVHHQEQVLDHMETEHYTEQVSDGYRSESYTEQVSCGQDCRDTPKSCHQECTSKKNGFASCKQVCSGGGRSCTTRYCSESRTRQVPKTRTVDRTREVPRYRSEPRYAEAFHYKAWTWAADRTVHAEGTDATALRWPDNGARTTGLPEGEQEREKRHAKYTVTLRYHGDDKLKFDVATADAFGKFGPRSEHAVVRKQETFLVDGLPVTPVP